MHTLFLPADLLNIQKLIVNQTLIQLKSTNQIDILFGVYGQPRAGFGYWRWSQVRRPTCCRKSTCTAWAAPRAGTPCHFSRDTCRRTALAVTQPTSVRAGCKLAPCTERSIRCSRHNACLQELIVVQQKRVFAKEVDSQRALRDICERCIAAHLFPVDVQPVGLQDATCVATVRRPRPPAVRHGKTDVIEILATTGGMARDHLFAEVSAAHYMNHNGIS